MKRRNFLRALGLAPLAPLAVKAALPAVERTHSLAFEADGAPMLIAAQRAADPPMISDEFLASYEMNVQKLIEKHRVLKNKRHNFIRHSGFKL